MIHTPPSFGHTPSSIRRKDPPSSPFSPLFPFLFFFHFCFSSAGGEIRVFSPFFLPLTPTLVLPPSWPVLGPRGRHTFLTQPLPSSTRRRLNMLLSLSPFFACSPVPRNDFVLEPWKILCGPLALPGVGSERGFLSLIFIYFPFF